jgi:hypothetical protein
MLLTHIQGLVISVGFLAIQAVVATPFGPPTSSFKVARAPVIPESPRATFVTSQDGTRIYTEARGNKHGPHLILAPGFAASARSLDPLFNEPFLYKKFYLVKSHND